MIDPSSRVVGQVAAAGGTEHAADARSAGGETKQRFLVLTGAHCGRVRGASSGWERNPRKSRARSHNRNGEAEADQEPLAPA
jgi:hypothetical protein